jgi:hypothetical protein
VNCVSCWRLAPRILHSLAIVALLALRPDTSLAQTSDDTVVENDGLEEEAQAANLFEAAEAAFSSQDYERAARLFARADQKAPHASVLFNAAVSWDYAGQRPAAADAYKTALQRPGLTASQMRQAEQRLAELSKLLGFVQIAKPIGGLATVGHLERQPIPVEFYEEPGSYHVQLETRAGAITTTDIEVHGGQVLRVELNPVETPVVVTLPPAVNSEQPKTTPIRDVPKVDTGTPTQEIIGWAALGLGVIGAGLATYWGLETEKQQERYLEGGRSSTSAYDRGLALRTRTNITWVAAGLTAGTGLTLVLTSPRIEF